MQRVRSEASAVRSMTWTRLDDNWTRKIRALRLDFQTRWHYLEMIQFVSASDTFEAAIRPVDARTCSDVDDPAACLAELEERGLVSRDSSGDYTLPRIAEHIPSQDVRDKTTAEREKKRRQRAHGKGDHSLCSFPACPAADVPGTVPRDNEGHENPEQPCPAKVPGTVGTGQDGPGREELPPATSERDSGDNPWGTVPAPRLEPALVRGPGCGWCDGEGCPQCDPEDYD